MSVTLWFCLQRRCKTFCSVRFYQPALCRKCVLQMLISCLRIKIHHQHHLRVTTKIDNKQRTKATGGHVEFEGTTQSLLDKALQPPPIAPLVILKNLCFKFLRSNNMIIYNFDKLTCKIIFFSLPSN